jgi:TolB-like protein
MSTREASRTINLFPESLIREQIQKIFLNRAFSVSEILRRFLSYIIQETLAGRSNTIKEYTIAVNVLNKPADFKPQHDAIVRIHAGRLRRALNEYYRRRETRNEIEIAVPKGRYVPVFSAPGTTLRNSKTFEKELHNVKIAVMPFRTFETDISRLAFTDSLGQQLSAEFARFSDFSVVSYYTTQQLGNKNREVTALSSKLGVQYVITGNAHFETGKVRVTVQVTNTGTGMQIWTELFHRNYNTSTYFETADDIVTSILITKHRLQKLLLNG